MRRSGLASTVAAFVAGGILLNAVSAFADGEPVYDFAVATAVGAVETAVTKAATSIGTSITTTFTDLTNPDSIGALLTNGFTQLSNYSKAQVAANAQITDASNTANAIFQTELRDAQIRDEQTPSAQACLGIDGGQVITAASLQGWRATSGIEAITDNRGEGQPGTPAYNGEAQASQAASNNHKKRYCSLVEQTAGLCTVGAHPDADQREESLFGTDNLTDETGLNAANDFGATLIQPVPPSTLRGDQLISAEGQDEYGRRRAYNARMSLARGVVNYMIGMQSPGVTLTANQQQEMKNQGLAVPASGSWLQVVSLEINRRVGDLAWATGLQQMPPASVQREIATQQALTNYLLMQNFRVSLRMATMMATTIAQTEEQKFEPSVAMPSPGMASN